MSDVSILVVRGLVRECCSLCHAQIVDGVRASHARSSKHMTFCRRCARRVGSVARAFDSPTIRQFAKAEP